MSDKTALTGKMNGGLTVKSGAPETAEQDGAEERPSYEPVSPTGEKILSREEVLAQLAEQETHALNLFDADGRQIATLNLPPQFHTRFLNFHTRKYEWLEDGSFDYQDIGDADAPQAPASNPTQ